MNALEAGQTSSEDVHAAEWLRRLVRHERGAMEQLYGLYQDAVYRFALVRVQSAPAAAQLLHEQMLGVWRGTARWTGEMRPRTWLLQLVARATLDMFTPDAQQSDEQADPSTATLVADRTQPLQENLHLALRRLPERYRSVLHLAYYEHLSDAEIAVVLERTESSVAWERRQGRDALASLAGREVPAEEKGRELFADAWLRRELRMPPEPAPCDFGLDRLKVGMRQTEQKRRQDRLRRRFLQRPLARLRRWWSSRREADRASVVG